MRTLADDFGGYLPGTQIPLIIEEGGRREISTFVESGSSHANFGVVVADPADQVTISLIKPTGVVISETGAPGVEFLADSRVRTFKVTGPEAGTWKLVVNAGTVRTGDLSTFANIKHEGVSFSAWVANEGLTFSTESVRLYASPSYGGRRVVGSSVTGTVTRPDGSKVSIILFDDGLEVHGDAFVGDGIYSALFNQYSSDGTYIFDLISQNIDGHLYEGEPLPDENGVVETFPKIPAPAFTRVTSTTAVVAGLTDGDMVWVDDGIPQGAVVQGDWYWVDANPAPVLGGASHQSKTSAPYSQTLILNEHSFTGATSKLPINVGDRLFTYVFLDPNSMPREIMLSWHTDDGWEHRAYWGANVLPLGNDGTDSRRYMGRLPEAGSWVRLEVPASAIGLEGKVLDGMAFTVDRNRATWDRAGRARGQASPAPIQGDFVWFDDNIPAGSVLEVVDDHWEWVTTSPSPFSGQKSHRSFIATKTGVGRLRSHGFSRAQTPMKVEPGDVLFTHVYLDPSFPPDQIMVQWNDGDGWEHRAFWGGNFSNVGVHGTESRRYMGGLPPAGMWVRLEVPASYVGLEGKSVSGMHFGLYKQNDRSRATWDLSGKSTRVTYAPAPLQAIIPLYRFYNSEYGYSYSTNDIGRGEQILQGIQCYVHPNQAAGTLPVYRFRKADRQYFYTFYFNGPDRSQWYYDGIAFYMHPTGEVPKTMPLHLLHDSKFHYFLTTNLNEAVGMTYDYIAGYVYNINPLTVTAPSNARVKGRCYDYDKVSVYSLTTLVWDDNSDNEAGFKIERRLNRNGTWTQWEQTATVGPDQNNFCVTSSCWYDQELRVRATNAAGDTDPTNTVSLPRRYSGCFFFPAPVSMPGMVQAEDFDTGGEGVSHHDSTPGNDGGQYRETDVDITATNDAGGGYRVSWVEAGEWLEYGVNITATGRYDIAARVASEVSDSSFHIEIDGIDVTGPLSVPHTGGADVFQTVMKAGVSLTAGDHSMRVVMSGPMSLNHITFQPYNAPPAVSLTAPSGNQTIPAGSNVHLAASASDADGTITKVEFYQNLTLIGEDTTAPYGLTWSNVAEGSYTLTAKAIDNGGAVTNSTPLTLNVTASSPYSLAFDGATGYMEVANSPSINLTGAFTAEAWIKTNNSTGAYQSIMERFGAPDASGNNGGFILRLNPAGKIEFFVLRSEQAGYPMTGNTVVTAGGWHHVAAVSDGTQMRVYLDGVLDGTLPVSFFPYTGTSNLFIGRGAGNYGYFNGLIDEARLTASALYNTDFTPSAVLTAGADTRGLWRFDSQSPHDFTGNGNTGTLRGAASYSAVTASLQNHSLSLNGSGGHARVPYSASLDVQGPFTVEAWFKINNTGTNQYLASCLTSTGGFILMANAGMPQLYVTNSAGQSDFAIAWPPNITFNEWHHMAGVADGTQIRVYLDGALVASKNSTVVPGSFSGSTMTIGAYQDGTSAAVSGLVDEVRVSAGAVYANTFTPKRRLMALGAGTRGLWKLDGQTLQDASGNGNNGTLSASGAAYSSDVP